jgi:Ca-activated chloride channel family protein
LDLEFKKTFECVGNYYDATTEASFKTAMGIIINQALNSTTAQVNLLDAYGKPTETNVPFTLYDSFSGAMVYNYVHTLNNKGNPDTITLDPVPTYKMVVHTIPPVQKDKITITPGKHNVIGIDAPQGDLIMKTPAVNEYKTLQFIIRKKGDPKTLHVQDINEVQRYLTGKYEIEVLCLPRITIPDVDISQSKTTTVTIPQPGIANISTSGPGYGQIFVEEKNQLKFVYTIPENSTRETVVLQPGKYRAVYRSKSSKETIYTVERSFTIESGGSVAVKLF